MISHCRNVRHPLFHWMAAVVMAIALILIAHSPVAAQTPSDRDTLRVVSQIGLPGDTIKIDIYVRNSVVLGGFGARFAFDSSRIHPVGDSSTVSGQTVFIPEVEQLPPYAFDLVSGSIADGVHINISCFEMAFQPPFFTPRGARAVRTTWVINSHAVPGQSNLVFQNDPVFPQSSNAFSDFDGLQLIRPVLTDGYVTIVDPAQCSCQALGDIDGNGWRDTVDLAKLIDYVYMNGPKPPQDASCPFAHRGELTCDGISDMVDVSFLADLVFGGGPLPCARCL